MKNNLALMSLAVAAGSHFEFSTWWWRHAYDARRAGDFDGAAEADENATRWTIDPAQWLIGTVSRPSMRALWIRRDMGAELRALDQLVCDAVNGDTDITLEQIMTLAQLVSARMTPHLPCAEHTS